MSRLSAKEMKTIMLEQKKSLLSSKKRSQEFLIRAGIHDKNGHLNKNYAPQI